MARVDDLSIAERRHRERYHTRAAIAEAERCAELGSIQVALEELVRAAGVRDQTARLDGLGYSFRDSLRRVLAGAFAQRRGLHE